MAERKGWRVAWQRQCVSNRWPRRVKEIDRQDKGIKESESDEETKAAMQGKRHVCEKEERAVRL